VTEERRTRRRRSGEAAHSPEAGTSVYHPPSAGLPDQASPGGGSVLDSKPFWRRQDGRKRRRERADPARAHEPGPDGRRPVGERAHHARAHFLPLPEETVYRHLGAGERVLHQDSPAFSWFIVSHLLWFLGLALLIGGAIACMLQGWGWATLACIAGALLIVLVLFFIRMEERYTSYVITNARIMRMSGVFNLRVESIPWVRVTDIRFSQDFLERVISVCTLNIDSANETAGLRRMRGIADPEEFTRHLTDMIVAKQGATEPLGRESDYAIMPPDRSWTGFRKKRTGKARSVYVVDPEAANAGEPVVEEVIVEGGEEVAVVSEPRSAPAARRPTVAVEADPELPEDLSDMAKVSRKQMEEDRKRQDMLLGREKPPE
jgi:membrane protein YdbS with pleckstrin-like domain